MRIKTFIYILSLSLLPTVLPAAAQEKIIVLDEGSWQSDNGRISYFEDGCIVSNEWFRQVNGHKLGDTPNDIVQVNAELLAIAVNWSNIIQFIRPDGTAVAATEDVPNNRKLATDGRYVYVSSYAHECVIGGETRTFTRGYVAKIDASTFTVTDAVEVGYEPEGLALYDGSLFVVNTGGYAFQEGHDYETSIDVIDTATMQKVRSVETGQINLFGKISASGRYLCVNSPGDHYEIPAATIILDMEKVLSGTPDADCFVKLDRAATYNCTGRDGRFLAVGSHFSYITGEQSFDYITIDPAQAMATGGREGVSEEMPGTLRQDLMKLTNPYCIYVNPYTGYIYATDAGAYVSAGTMYQWTPQGEPTGNWRVYINPGTILALDPDASGIENIEAAPETGSTIYNLLGIPVTDPQPGNIYIRAGHKFIYRGN